MKTKRFYSILMAILFTVIGISAKAQGDWSVNANQFVYSMTITGQITTDGYLSEDVNDKIAAFINGECRGVTNVKYTASVNGYYVFLMVYSNDPTGTVTFKIYDDSENTETDVKETINFTVNDIVGSISNPFILSASNLSSQAQLLSFSIPNQVGETLITGNNVYLQEHWSGNLTGIAASFTLSDGAKAFLNGVEQVSGVTTNNFLLPVEYTIEAADLSSTTVYTINITTANDIPTDILLTSNQKEENDPLTFIGAFTVVTDNPLETHILSLVNAPATDNQFFYINGMGLREKAPFNYEEKTSYRILVRADDEKGGVVEKYFNIEILDANDAPTGIALVNANTPVNTPANSVLGDLFAIDEDAGDTHNFALVSGNGINDIDNNKFYIAGNELKNNTPLIFLSDSEYKIVVQATDAGGATVQVPLVISTQNLGNPPHNILLNNTMVVGINSPPVFVGTLSASDVDQTQNHVFTLPVNTEFGPDNQYFSIVTNSLYLNSPLPVSEKSNYEILIAVTDSMGNQFTKPFQIIVKAELGSGDFFLNNSNLPENQPYNTIVGYFDSETYESSEYTFSLPLEVDLNAYCNHEFKLNGRTLITNEVFDFEKENTVMIQVNVTDGIKKITQDIPVNIIDANDPPTSISLSNQILSESAPLNSVISTLSAEDQDFGDTHTFSLVVGNGINDEANGMFRINGNDLVLSSPLNYEQKSSHNILIRVTDAEGASFEQGLRLKVADANDAPEITSVPVNFTLQDQVYVYSIEVQDSEGDEVSLSFENLPAWLNFIPGSNLLSGVAGNNWVGVYQFNVVASDGKMSNKQTVILTVINVNDPPEVNYFLNQQEFFSTRENLVQLPNDCLIDPDVNDILTYKLSLENNSALPTWLHFNSEELTLSGNPPHEAFGIWKLKLTATDKGNLKEWMVFDLNVAYPTAIGDLNVNNEFKFYPNPVNTNLFVQIPNSNHPAFIEIYNVSGQKIKSVQFPQGTQNKINFEEFLPGVYIINFTQGNERCQKKLVKH